MPTHAEVRAELHRAFESTLFAGSGRMPQFLRHLVELALAGQGERLKGPVIAVEFFKRGKDFDPRLDPIVRVEARRLRTRLEEYYSGEGANNAIRIEIPRGVYVPVFLEMDPVPTQAGRSPVTESGGESWDVERPSGSNAPPSPAVPVAALHVATVKTSHNWLYIAAISLLAFGSLWLWSRKQSAD